MAVVLTTARAFATCEEAKKVLTDAGHEIKLVTPEKPLKAEELIPLIKDVDAAIAGLDFITADVINSAPKLKIIARNGVGYDRVDLDAAKKNNVYVTITPGTNSVSVCELAFSFITGLARKIHLMDKNVRAGSWKRENGMELYGKTIAIFGTGAIGKNLAIRCLAFGMKVIAYDLYPNAELKEKYGVKYYDEMDPMFEQADFISLHLPATDKTHHMINRQSISKMKKSVYIINTARGELIDDDALFEALTNGSIGGAGLDAFTTEPFTDSRFFSLNNVIMTPHTGAFTSDAVVKTLVMAAEEVVRVLAGDKPQHSVI
ncbi:phosphoglycerate dehydrogenase [Zophobihabitans entericus]|uniref:Phosphoglycerate dehydrogenase n=1 Tax=Zophobihabitans entericus TaxID=1635327 RepID=A0A6G9ID98_9GAMM|nr:phosphoglycerate dehydrogenase [Zophobihabitans entericus]QIQ22206.1 phosphoglycerate dehydrogenase [Zophobihabitans entericus]